MCDFQIIDELLFDADSLSEEQFRSALLDAVPALEFGPLMEFQFLRNQDHNRYWPGNIFSLSANGHAILAAWHRPQFSDNPSTASLLPFPVEVLRGPAALIDFCDPRWLAFGMRLQAAAEAMGVGKKFAQGISAALQEMASNAAEHSQLPGSALVGYCLQSNSFGFVVADAGEGLLTSLRRCQEFEHLRDSDEALTIALSDGVSRFGRTSGRGSGFRQLLKSLEFLGCKLRFRTGGFHLQVGGEQNSVNRLGQSSDYSGFLVSMTLKRN